jgi:hypothetical protein
MKYTKPEVSVLGAASEVIELVIAKQQNSNDSQPAPSEPAYDLDD